MEWYLSMSTVLEEHRWRRIFIDRNLTKTGNTRRVTTRSGCAVVAATRRHVDNFVFGRKGNKVWEQARKRLQDLFRWKMWESDNFTQSGVRIQNTSWKRDSCCPRVTSSMNSEKSRSPAIERKRTPCHTQSRQS